MIDLQPHEDGVILPVRAQPGSRVNAIRGHQDGALKVAVTQVAEKGKANKSLIAVLAKQLELRKSQVELISGTTTAQKRFLIRELSEDELRRRIDRVIET